MADERDRISDGGTDGGTAGTGEREVLPERDTPPPERGQGDDTADALGGDPAAGAGLSGAGAATGDGRAGRSESGSGNGLGGPDAGSPGGMGGVGAAGGTGTGRPPGGVSPVPPEEQEGR
ncbi:MAG: hypothetical protein JOZ90_13130 [Alphaproteobacteria bacterium]|nr:hypothetical protein [Alphaproteobacteria bacterium]MBV9370327.1 hypothetical protein [Alphaproteobacteria bacterium]MBV9902016.1 hypothetical protein [Alphaproteobacteria bacterium]